MALYCKTKKWWPLFICPLKILFFALNASSYTPTAIPNSPKREVVFDENEDRLLQRLKLWYKIICFQTRQFHVNLPYYDMPFWAIMKSMEIKEV